MNQEARGPETKLELGCSSCVALCSSMRITSFAFNARVIGSKAWCDGCEPLPSHSSPVQCLLWHVLWHVRWHLLSRASTHACCRLCCHVRRAMCFVWARPCPCAMSMFMCNVCCAVVAAVPWWLPCRGLCRGCPWWIHPNLPVTCCAMHACTPLIEHA